MNYAEEQELELEALSAIYPEEIEILKPDFPASFKILVTSDDFDEERETGGQCSVTFSYNETYPDTIPDIEIEEPEVVTEEECETICEELKAEAQQNTGASMIFTLCTALQELLHKLSEDRERRKDEAMVFALEAEEYKGRHVMEGTPCTVETFTAWRILFDAELAAEKATKKSTNVKLTGKEQFLKNADLNISDLNLLGGEGDDVKIDESLFDDLDDLDEEDFDDDED